MLSNKVCIVSRHITRGLLYQRVRIEKNRSQISNPREKVPSTPVATLRCAVTYLKENQSTSILKALLIAVMLHVRCLMNTFSRTKYRPDYQLDRVVGLGLFVLFSVAETRYSTQRRVCLTILIMSCLAVFIVHHIGAVILFSSHRVAKNQTLDKLFLACQSSLDKVLRKVET